MSKLDDVYTKVQDSIRALEASNLREEALIRLWDGDWKLLSVIQGDYEHSFSFEKNDAGNATVQLPVDHQVAQLVMDPDKWPTKSLYLTFDLNGIRWSGRVENTRVDISYQGDRIVEINAVHDYQKLKELLVWPNPFLPAEVQFPKAWFLFGPARWAVFVTLFVNMHRKGTSAWMLPDDPGDIRQWVDLDMSNWSMVVKPVRFGDDTSPTSVVSSRFKNAHETIHDICEDANLIVTCRRYLEGDPDPIPGKNLRHGCLVFEVEDKGGYTKPTAFGGSRWLGLKRGIKRITQDGMSEGIDYVSRAQQPSDYYKGDFWGTNPEAPWVVLEDGDYTGVNSSEFEYTPPGPAQFVTGGQSALGVNEAIKASIIGFGGLLGSIFNQSQLGSVADALLEPLYSDVFFAFKAEKDRKRISEQGWDYPYEYWADGSDRAYSLAGLVTMRRARLNTIEKFSVKVEMENGAPYWVGPPGHGDFFIGDRVAVHCPGMSEDKLMVENVEKLEYTRSDDKKEWDIEIGKSKFTTGLEYLSQRFQNTTEGLKEIGVW